MSLVNQNQELGTSKDAFPAVALCISTADVHGELKMSPVKQSYSLKEEQPKLSPTQKDIGGIKTQSEMAPKNEFVSFRTPVRSYRSFISRLGCTQQTLKFKKWSRRVVLGLAPQTLLKH